MKDLLDRLIDEELKNFNNDIKKLDEAKYDDLDIYFDELIGELSKKYKNADYWSIGGDIADLYLNDYMQDFRKGITPKKSAEKIVKLIKKRKNKLPHITLVEGVIDENKSAHKAMVQQALKNAGYKMKQSEFKVGSKGDKVSLNGEMLAFADDNWDVVIMYSQVQPIQGLNIQLASIIYQKYILKFYQKKQKDV